MTGTRCDRGNATVLVLALTFAVAVVAALSAAVGAAAVARHRAASAADLAALAAADRALAGAAVACAAAARATAAVGAELSECRVSGDVADVVASVRPSGALGSWGVARSHSRAGPSRR
ncbi:MAG: helicase [Frankiaceae bacterium]|nr:helicase [Frankiaceae bacterium]